MAANLYKPRPTTSMLRAPGSDAGNNSQNLRSLNPGSVVMDRYTIQKVIGRGGMATVYLAKNQETERLVALKILDPEISSDPSYVERFRREARAAGRIRSDHVVATYDLGTDESGTLVLVMEYLEGQTVQQALRNGRLPLHRAMILGRQLCEGLAAAHENGVIHRDLKPANLFIERLTGGAEKLKILDFGISKLSEVSSQELTRAGQTLGTLAYMAPEQIRGAVKGNDPRIDLYSAGVSLFLMFTAKRPIDAEDTVQLLQAVLEKPPLTLGQAAGVEFPPSVEAFVARALQKDPVRRYQSALEMRDALLQAAHDAGVDAIAHFSSPNGAPPPMQARQSAAPEISSPGVSTIMEAAPTFTPPSGVIVSAVEPSNPSAMLTLPSFDDDDEEGKTEVRAPGGMQMTGPSSPLPLAGRRPTGANLPAANPDGSLQGAPQSIMRPPTMAPRGPAANGQMTMPPSSLRAQTILGVPPAPESYSSQLESYPQQPTSDAPPTMALDVFGGMPPGFAPPPQVSGAPGSPMYGMAPSADGGQPQSEKKRSPMKFLLIGASMVSLTLIAVSGYVAMGNRGASTARASTQAVIHAPVRAVAAALPAQAATAPVAQPLAAPAPVAQPLRPSAAAPAQPVAQVLLPAPAAQPAPAAPVAAPPVAPIAQPAPAAPETPEVATAPVEHEHPNHPHHPHHERPEPQVAAHAPAAHPAAHPTHALPPMSPVAPAARPPRAPRVRRGPITEVPF